MARRTGEDTVFPTLMKSWQVACLAQGMEPAVGGGSPRLFWEMVGGGAPISEAI